MMSQTNAKQPSNIKRTPSNESTNMNGKQNQVGVDNG